MLKTIGEILSNNIRLRRKALGLTQAEFSAKIEMIYRTYQSIESGETWPQKANLETIAHGLNVHPQVLFQDPDAPIPPDQALEALRLFIKAHK